MRKPLAFYQQNLLNPKGHETCLHWKYLVNCHGFELLLARSNGTCEICGMPGFQNMRRKLFIDHDYRLGEWAIRGLLCSQCNMDLDYRRADAVTKAFNANPFYLQILKAWGSPLSMAEPPVGSSVVDFWGRTWAREPDEWHIKPLSYDGRRRRYSQHDWTWLHRRNGPHILGRKLVLPG